MTNPFVHCQNPLILSMRLYYLFTYLNHKVFLNDKDVRSCAKELLVFTGELIDEISHKSLVFMISETDLLGKNFFDYFFSANAIELENQ